MEITNPAALKIIEESKRRKEEKIEKRKEQHRKYSIDWWNRNKERSKIRRVIYTKANKERLSAKRREERLRSKYGLTIKEHTEMFIKQGSCCACCGSTDPGSKFGWVVDHCHKSKAVRSITCNHCNRGLGAVKDNIETLKKMIAYLERYVT